MFYFTSKIVISNFEEGVSSFLFSEKNSLPGNKYEIYRHIFQLYSMNGRAIINLVGTFHNPK